MSAPMPRLAPVIRARRPERGREGEAVTPPGYSERGDDRAGVVLLDEGADVLGVQQLVERLQRLVVLVLGAHHEHVRVGVVLAGFEYEGILGRAQIGLEGVVAVD